MEQVWGPEREWDDEARRAGVAPRAVAAVIDTILSALVIGLPLAVATGEHTTVTDATGTTHYWTMGTGGFFFWGALTIVYFTVLETVAGATVGKLVLGLRVRCLDGSPIGFGSALARNLFRIVDCFPYFLPYLVGAVSIWSGADRQRVGDRIAATVVVWRE